MTPTGAAEEAVPCLALDIELTRVGVALVGDDVCAAFLNVVAPLAAQRSLGGLLDFTYGFAVNSLSRGNGVASLFTETASAREVAFLGHCVNFEARSSSRGIHGPLDGAAHVGRRGVS